MHIVRRAGKNFLYILVRWPGSYAFYSGLVSFMNGRYRKDIRPGLEVMIVLKKDQRSGKLTRGVVKDILTNSPEHPHGIKVRLVDGQVGRVKQILS